MITQNRIVATAGHIDHGKSALVKALTGTDPDRLPEEKKRGLTIDLGFAEFELSTGDRRFHVGLIDVPGQEDFVKNMIAGVGSIDLALLVIAANDGWMPQTEEHLEILTYLGVQRAVVALTKADLSPTGPVIDEVYSKLRQTKFDRAPIVETSTVTGHGIEQLKETLANELSRLPPPRDLGKPRLFVDRAFSLPGIGTVVTGTLTGGSLTQGQKVMIHPHELVTRVRTIQSHGRERKAAESSTRVALNLPDIKIGKEHESVRRGDVVTLFSLGVSVNSMDVLLERSSRSVQTIPINHNTPVWVHHGTSRTTGRILFSGARELPTEKSTLAHLELESSLYAFLGDRLVLRDSSNRHTLAGGRVLDLGTTRKQFRERAHLEFLRARSNSPNDALVAVQSELLRDGARDAAGLLVQSIWSASEIASTIERLVTSGEIVAMENIVADAAWWKARRHEIIARIDNEHRQRPHLAGHDVAQLRAALPNIAPEILDALIVDLKSDGYERSGNLIKRAAHAAALPPGLEAKAVEIRHLLSKTPFDPPARKTIAADPESREALNFLIRRNEIIELGPDLVLSGGAFSQMKAAIAAFIAANGPATVSDIRQALGSSRRVVVPLLERLDRNRFTRRVGDKRILAARIVAPAHSALE